MKGISRRSSAFRTTSALLVGLSLLVLSHRHASGAGDTVTVKAIVPDPPAHRVILTFDGPCEPGAVQAALKIYPPVQLRSVDRTDPNRIAVQGAFNAGEKYDLSFPDDFRCDGRRFVRGVASFRMPDLPTKLSFVDGGSVIERDSRQILNASLTNADELAVRLIRIPPVLVPRAHDEAAWANLPLEELRPFFEKALAAIPDAVRRDGELARFLGTISEDRREFTPKKERNESHSFSIPLSFRRDREKGAVALVAVDSRLEAQAAPAARRLIRITDLGLAGKRSRGSLLVWATSLRSGLPLEGVSILAAAGDGRLVPLGKTGKNGLLDVRSLAKKRVLSADPRVPPKPVSPGEVSLLLAATGDDCSYLRVGAEGVVRPDWLPSGEPVRIGDRLLKGRIFTERGIYRPGDPVTFKGTFRGYLDGAVAPPGALPVEVTAENAKGEEIYRKTLTLSEFGTVSDRIGIAAHYPLGTYTIRMRPAEAAGLPAPPLPSRAAGDDVEGSDDDGTDEVPPPSARPADTRGFTATFEVQEFRPPRHFVSIRFRKKTVRDDSYVNLARETALLECEIAGSYYAGGGVKNGKVRWKIGTASTSFRRKGLDGFVFGSAAEAPGEMIESGEALLDEKGRAVVTVPLSPEALSGTVALSMTATVVDFDGRAASAEESYQEEPAYLVGVGTHDDQVGAGEAQVLRLVIVDPEGGRVPAGTIQAEVHRKEWVYLRKRNEQGEVYWRGEEVYRRQLSAPVALKDGQALFEFDFRYGGTYILKFTYAGGDGIAYHASTRYQVIGPYYGWDAERVDRKFEKLSAAADRRTYAPGETARVFISPHRKISSLLVTVERENVIESRVVSLAPGEKFVDIPLDAKHAPNSYVTLLGTVARGEFPVNTGAFDDEAPTFVFGAAALEVRRKAPELKLTVNEDEASLAARPGEGKTLSIAAKDGKGAPAEAEIAIAVVDESVLAMTGFGTPDLSDLARFLVPLGVTTAELRTRLMLQTPYGFVRVDRLTGGDGAAGKGGVASKLRKDFNPVAYINPSVRTGPDGTATVSFKLPDTMTTYRVYAVACDRGSAFASAQKPLLVVKEFHLEPGTPAFLTRGDRFTLLVSAFNKTREAGRGTFSAGKDDLVRLLDVPSSFELAPLDRTLVAMRGEADAPGTARLSFAGRFGEFDDAVEIKVPVNSGHLIWRDVVSGTFKGSAAIRYAFPTGTESIPWKELGPRDVRAILTVSGSPLARVGPALRYLLHYPYGCVEQTSSGVTPLAALRGLAREGMLPGITVEETDKFVRPGIDRLLAMQIDSGGFGYWPGYREVHPWGTVYAMTALTIARAAGVPVPENRLWGGLGFLADAAVNGEGKNDPTYKAYAAWILAMNGKLSEAVFRNAHESIWRPAGSGGTERSVTDALEHAGREAALLTVLAGRIGGHIPDDRAKALVREILDKQWTRRARDVFFARYRDPAVALLAAASILPGEPVAWKQAERLLQGINPQGYWTSTSDTGWSLMALGEYFRGTPVSAGTAAVTVRQPGRPDVVESLDLRKVHTFALDPALFLRNPEVALTVGGGGAGVYQLQLDFPRIDYSTKGYSNGFTIGKTIKPLEGGDRVTVGDVVRVDVTVETGFRDLHYIVLDDPLPAGLTAINTALKTEERPAGGAKADGDPWSYWDPESGVYRFNPNHFELRDDRVVAFRDRLWWGGKFRYSYYARAVLAGEFVVPSSKVQLMYEPDVAGYTPATKLVIEER